MAEDNLNVMLKLEQKLDLLLERYRDQGRELQALRAENQSLRQDRERVCAELDRILAKLDDLGGDSP